MLFVSDPAKEQINRVKANQGMSDDYFIRVSVVSGGCSGLSYKMDFDNEEQAQDQVFEDNGIKIVTDLKSFLYLFNTTLQFSGGLSAKAFTLKIPMRSENATVAKALQFDLIKYTFLLAGRYFRLFLYSISNGADGLLIY